MISIYAKPPPPKSPLNRYRLLCPTANIKVSPLCLGSMGFGSAWREAQGDYCDRNRSEAILDFFYDHGGNFLDTSNNYQCGEAEEIIGQWMQRRGNRDEMVIATKYTTNSSRGPNAPGIMANFAGNGAKNLHISVRSSLKRLQTSYIDLLYVHWWDYSSGIPELMQSLNQLVISGKVLYLGVSNTPAWVVCKANEYARHHGLRQFSVYQGRWSAAQRDMEREIIPMCQAEGMAIVPWGAPGLGKFKTEDQFRMQDWRRDDALEVDIRTSRVLEGIAARKRTSIPCVALAYVMRKAPYVFPIIEARRIEYLVSCIEALILPLSDAEIAEIDDAVPFPLGFPHELLWGPRMPDSPQKVWLLDNAAHWDHVPNTKPIKPSKTGE